MVDMHLQVLGGADLFLQGFIVTDESPGEFNTGDVRVVAVPGNPFPFALGTMETSSEAAATSGMKGKGLKLLHHYPDLLWALGDKTTPDPSFTPLRIFPQVWHVLVHGASDAHSSPPPPPRPPCPGLSPPNETQKCIWATAHRDCFICQARLENCGRHLMTGKAFKLLHC